MSVLVRTPRIARPSRGAVALALMACAVPAPAADEGLIAAPPRERTRSAQFRTELFGRRYDLADPGGTASYAGALDAAIRRSQEEAELEKAFKRDPTHVRLPRDFVDKKMRRAMQETREAVTEYQRATGTDRTAKLSTLFEMAEAIRASYMPVLPGNMDVFTAVAREARLRRSPVGLGDEGLATDADAGHGRPGDTSLCDPVQPSSFWSKPADIARRDLYYGFDRPDLPNLGDQVCVFREPKTGYGTHGGFKVTCERYGKVTLKMGKEHCQPFAQRVFWALGFNTVPYDCAREVRVRWDPRILTQYNARRDSTFAVTLLGAIRVHREHLQRYCDPFENIAEVVTADDRGNQVVVRPNPTWDDFRRRLFKNPRGHPELSPGNIVNAFADRIRYVVYRDVNIKVEAEEAGEEDSGSDGDGGHAARSVYLGNWDWDSDSNRNLRENRGAALVAAWLNMFDPRVCNNETFEVKRHGHRQIVHCYADVGVCLGRADDATRMREQLPNDLPWRFTRPTRTGSRAIPLDGSYHPIQACRAFQAADIDDARWAARYLAQLTGPQLLQALVASGFPSAQVRLYYDKLVERRNAALHDLGIAATLIEPLDQSREFDYDPRRDGPITVVTSRGEKVTAPDDGWIVRQGRCVRRAQ